MASGDEYTEDFKSYLKTLNSEKICENPEIIPKDVKNLCIKTSQQLFNRGY